MSYAVNAIYPTYQGEVNRHGIGAPVIFLRLQGCHIRCYAKTIGILCDTPEGLEKSGGETMSLDRLKHELLVVSAETNIRYICLTGGDPLWRNPKDVYTLLDELTRTGFEISVETSGTLSIAPYRSIKGVHWVMDYKLKSAGIKQPFVIGDIPLLDKHDFIKLVVYDEADYDEAVLVIKSLVELDAKCKIAIGLYWGGKMSSETLMNNLLRDKILGDVVINMQAHKLLTHADHSDVSVTHIPRLL